MMRIMKSSNNKTILSCDWLTFNIITPEKLLLNCLHQMELENIFFQYLRTLQHQKIGQGHLHTSYGKKIKFSFLGKGK